MSQATIQQTAVGRGRWWLVGSWCRCRWSGYEPDVTGLPRDQVARPDIIPLCHGCSGKNSSNIASDNIHLTKFGGVIEQVEVEARAMAHGGRV